MNDRPLIVFDYFYILNKMKVEKCNLAILFFKDQVFQLLNLFFASSYEF